VAAFAHAQAAGYRVDCYEDREGWIREEPRRLGGARVEQIGICAQRDHVILFVKVDGTVEGRDLVSEFRPACF
jgi:hypothetical protein